MVIKKDTVIFAFYVCVALFLSRSFTFIFEREEGIGSSSSFQIIALIVYVASTYILINTSRIKIFFYESRYILIFIFLMFLSSIWSDIPGKTFSRSIAMLGTLIFAYIVYRTLNIEQFIKMYKHLAPLMLLAVTE